ncbi:hypothetical protein HL653_05990 [Sphingomonas sp. AP4-R1]|uniref:hypothetical protein n=1 Tax=Sphingomonas sp. AP4-R1 TaxID=2735134 RepID=UPI0014939DB1|nr:hypothetical protein [Sphingomonas sp. AP4-R1]QJU57401.1 hypothetical protein HL653_05990 [Sphingomonas sp. AP4-R1]
MGVNRHAERTKAPERVNHDVVAVDMNVDPQPLLGLHDCWKAPQNVIGRYRADDHLVDTVANSQQLLLKDALTGRVEPITTVVGSASGESGIFNIL